jgi:protoheme IX farnesyltransferase
MATATAASIAAPSPLAAIWEATKPRITRLVTITSGIGFTLAALPRRWEWTELAVTATAVLLGTGLSAAGANALNQWLERDRDALMPRTCNRPLPEQRLSPAAALAAGSVLAVAGVGLLWGLCGPAPALVSLTTVLVYLLLYTPLKPVTPHATLVGAVPGALPPLIGYSAAAATGLRSLIEPGALALFAIMFIWQIPHFLAIAWMYRDDYAKGGYRVLPVVDSDGRRTGRAMVLWAALLIPAAMAPAWTMKPVAAWAYGLLALAMGVGYLLLVVRAAQSKERVDARRAFIASVIHLPLLLMLIVACAALSRML